MTTATQDIMNSLGLFLLKTSTIELLLSCQKYWN